MTTFLGYDHPNLFDQPQARATDPATPLAARFRKSDPLTSSAVLTPATQKRLNANGRVVLRAFASAGNDGLNAHEVAERCGLSRIEVSRRAAELDAAGQVEKTGERRPLETGHMGVCRRVTAAGLLALRELKA